MKTNQESEPQEDNETYKSIFENMRSGVAYQKILLDEENNAIDFIFLEVNKSFANIVGLDRQKAIGMKFSDVMPNVKSSAFNWVKFYDKLATAGREIKFEQYLQDAQRWYAVSAYSVKKNYFITIYDDITERKKAEESLRAAYVKLKTTQSQLIQAEKMEAVGRLTAGVTHEIKNPLAIIQQSVDYLNKKIVTRSKEVAFALFSIEEAVERTSAIITSLLAFSRTSNDKMVPENINEIIKSALFLVKNDMANKEITVTTKFTNRLPKINLDRISIEQVLINLFMNSMAALKSGGKIVIKTSLGADEYGKPSVIVVIEDDGTGIPENLIDKVFDPFFTTKKVGQGTGLGLFIVKSILTAHGANVNIENIKENTGLRVTIVFGF